VRGQRTFRPSCPTDTLVVIAAFISDAVIIITVTDAAAVAASACIVGQRGEERGPTGRTDGRTDGRCGRRSCDTHHDPEERMSARRRLGTPR